MQSIYDPFTFTIFVESNQNQTSTNSLLLHADLVDSLLLLCRKVLQLGTCWLPFYAEAFSTVGNPNTRHFLELDLSAL